MTSIYGAVINLAVDIATMKFIGLFAASISTFLGFFVMWLVRLHDTKESFPININIKKFIPMLLIVLAMAAASIWTNNIIDIILSVITTAVFCIHNFRYLKMAFKKIKSRFVKS